MRESIEYPANTSMSWVNHFVIISEARDYTLDTITLRNCHFRSAALVLWMLHYSSAKVHPYCINLLNQLQQTSPASLLSILFFSHLFGLEWFYHAGHKGRYEHHDHPHAFNDAFLVSIKNPLYLSVFSSSSSFTSQHTEEIPSTRNSDKKMRLPSSISKLLTTHNPLTLLRHLLRTRIPLFRIFYSTSLFLASCLLAALLLITPGDHIYQAFRSGPVIQLYNVFIVGGSYIVLFVVAVLVYAARLFQTRSALAGVMGVRAGGGGSSGDGWLRFGDATAPAGGGWKDDSDAHHDHHDGANWSKDGNRDGSGKGGGGRREKGTMRFGGKRVQRRVETWIQKGWRRSAVVAFWGRPRDLSGDEAVWEATVEERDGVDEMPALLRRRRKGMQTTKPGQRSVLNEVEEVGEFIIDGEEDQQEEKNNDDGDDDDDNSVGEDWEPVWGEIKHPGWSWGSTLDHQGVQFDSVIVELGGLVEAKAVSLAPLEIIGDEPDGNGADDANGTDGQQGGVREDSTREKITMPDPLVVNLLQRSVSMGLREYIAHLTTLGMIDPPDIGDDFLSRYERARFSGKAMAEADFEALMGLFADILSGMQPVRWDIVEGLRARADDDDDDAAAEFQDRNDYALEDEATQLDIANWEEGLGDDEFLNNDKDHHHNHNHIIVDRTDTTSLISNSTVNHNPPPPVSHSSSPSSPSSSSSSALSATAAAGPPSPSNSATALPHLPSSRPRNHRYASAKSRRTTTTVSRTSSSSEEASAALSDEAGSVIRRKKRRRSDHESE